MPNKIKKTWGGARAGSGRKIKENKKITRVIFFRVDEADYELLKKIAQDNNLSVGQYARKVALEKLNKNDNK